MSSNGIFVGTAGVYHVMCELSLCNFHAAATHGNAPDFDILVCSSTGDTSAMIQVKSSRSAKRTRHFDFSLSYRAAKMRRLNFFVAFVDFDEPSRQEPVIYFVPSVELNEKCKDWIDKYVGRMIRFKPEFEWMEKFKVTHEWKELKAIGIQPS